MSEARTTAEELRSYVERVESIEGTIKEFNDDKRDLYAEVKGKGFDVKAFKAVIAYRRKDPSEAAEQRSLFDLYLAQVSGSVEAKQPNKRTSGVPKAAAMPSKQSLAHAREETEPPATGEPVSEYQEPSSDSSAPQPLDDRSDAAGSPVAGDELIPAFLRRDPEASVWRT